MITPYSINLNGSPSMNNNVIEIYKQNTVEEVRADLDKNRTKLINICMNLTHDFNKASAIRANNAFLGKELYMVGRKRYDKRGAVGTYLYEHCYHADTLEEVIDYLHVQNYKVYAVDNIEKYNPINIWDCNFPEKSAFVYGEENAGLSEESIALCDGMVYISQYGSVRSLNVAQAAACIMMEYSRRYH